METCFGLMRFSGMLGFFVLGFGSFHFGNQWLGLNLDMSELILANLEGKAIALFIVSSFIGLIGLLIGQGVGASIRIRSDKVSNFIDIIWHSAANGCIVWFLLTSSAIGIIVGKDKAKLFIESFGTWKFTFVLMKNSLISSWLIAFEYFIVGKWLAKKKSDEIAVFVPWTLSLITGVTIGIFQSIDLSQFFATLS